MKLMEEREKNSQKTSNAIILVLLNLNGFRVLPLKSHMKIVFVVNKLFRTTVLNYHTNKLPN